MMAEGRQHWVVVMVVLLLGFFLGLGMCQPPSEGESTQFDVKPGGQVNHFTKESKGFSCQFTYACQGGTHEQWEITLHRSLDKKIFTCAVSRPSGVSYLFFQEFNLQIKGAQIQDAGAMGNSGRELSKEEYNINKSENSVTQVSGKFKSELTKVEIMATKLKKKREL